MRGMLGENACQFAPGELLFLGGSGGESTGWEFAELTLPFAANPNRTGITIGDISGIDKKGWEYLPPPLDALWASAGRPVGPLRGR
ncbi:MAG: hypothetical protein MUP47_08100 [Phycisphaerae bacterium]|nr:hypothetical protein [Phycisphaerae bacterium]